MNEEYSTLDFFEFFFGTSPFDGWTEEEIEEYQRQLNGDFEEDYQRNGRF